MEITSQLRVNQITPAHVRRWQSELLSSGLSVLFWTGLCISELLSLRADDIYLEARTLMVNKGFQTINGKEIIMDTKTPRSRRVIPLPERYVMRSKPI